jgi:hypothetical protein
MLEDDFIQIAQGDIEPLYAGRNIILCNNGLVDLLTRAIRPNGQVISYTSSGKIGAENGQAFNLSQLGLPTGINIIVGYNGCKVFRTFKKLARDSGYPGSIAFLGVPAFLPARLQRRLIKRQYFKLFEVIKEQSINKLSDAEQQVSRLRQEVEALKAGNRGAAMMLEKIGISYQELLLEDMPLQAIPLDKKLVQPLPSLLCDIGGISICSAPSKSATRVKLSVTAAGKPLVERMISLKTSGGWAEIFFPQELLMEYYGGELVVEPIDLDAQILIANGLADHRTSLVGHEGQRLALRIWRPHFGDLVQPDDQRAIRLLDLPELRDKSIESHCAGTVKQISQNRVLLEAGDDGKAQYFLTDIALENVQSITANCTWLKSSTDKAKVTAWVVDASNREEAKAVFRERKHKSAIQSALGVTEIEILPNVPVQITVPIKKADAKLRGSLLIECQLDNAKAENDVFSVSDIELNFEPKLGRAFYKCASFVELTRHIQYADGPLAELADNDAAGFPLVSSYEVGGFVQTHARKDDITAIRIDNLVPAGTSRIWVDVSLGHEKANDTEFCVYLTSAIPAESFSDQYRLLELSDLTPNVTHYFDDGAIFKKIVVSGGQSKCINFNLADTIDRPLTAYLFVRPLDGDPKLGWCRWHRIGMTGHSALSGMLD